MSTLEIKKNYLLDEIKVPSSKSYANRALILAANSNTPMEIRNIPDATDVVILLNSLTKVGLQIFNDGQNVTINNSFPECETDGAMIEVGEGGTTARFLAGMLLKGKKPYHLILGDRLAQRPWNDFIKLVQKYGGKAQLTGKNLFLQGPVNFPEKLEIDCEQTTQFATAITLSFHKTTCVTPINFFSSQSYWQLTEKLINDLDSMPTFEVPLDWSSASYPLAFGALSQPIFFPGLFFDSSQSDAKFFRLLEKFECIEESKEGVKVSPTMISFNVIFDASDALDLVPALAFFLSHIQGRHEISGISNLIHKESNRLEEIIKLLKEFNRETFVNEKSLIIKGSPARILDQKNLVMPNDHRMVMTAALFLLHHGGGTLSPAEAVNKSYPGFFSIFNQV